MAENISHIVMMISKASTYIIQTYRAPMVTVRCLPILVQTGIHPSNNIVRGSPWFRISQSGSKGQEALIGLVKVLISL
jgi:hypothetical protein